MKPIRQSFSMQLNVDYPRQEPIDLLGDFRPPPDKPHYTLTIRYGPNLDPTDDLLIHMESDGIRAGTGNAYELLAKMIERANRPDPEPPPTVFLSDLTVRVFSDDPETLVDVFYKGDPVFVNVRRDAKPPM